MKRKAIKLKTDENKIEEIELNEKFKNNNITNSKINEYDSSDEEVCLIIFNKLKFYC